MHASFYLWARICFVLNTTSKSSILSGAHATYEIVQNFEYWNIELVKECIAYFDFKLPVKYYRKGGLNLRIRTHALDTISFVSLLDSSVQSVKK